MKLHIKNLAHIDSASVNDESDLTIIVGDNGSGKTLLLETYTLLSEEIFGIRSNITASLMSNYITNFKIVFDDETINLLKDIFSIHKNISEETYDEEIPRRHLINRAKEKLIEAIPNIENGIQLKATIEISNIDEINSSLKRSTHEMKKKFISLAESKILFNSKEIGDIDFINSIPVLESNNELFFELGLGASFWQIKGLPFLRLIPTSSEEFDLLSWEKIQSNINLRVLSVFMNSKLNNNFIDISNSDVLFMPTERNSIIANSNLRTRKELENSKIFSRYSEFSFTMEFLKFKEEIGGHGYNFFEESSQFSELNSNSENAREDQINILYKKVKELNISNLEGKLEVNTEKSTDVIRKKHSNELREMLGGQLVYDKNGELNSIIDFNGNIIDKKLFSTKQNHMSSLAILEENIFEYNVFVIEEPEANLSLKAIKQLVNYLFSLIQEYKIKLILTTHNELFFQRLNLKLLQNSDISSTVYEFETHDHKSKLKKLDKNDFGYSVNLFNTELESIFNEANETQNS